MAKTLLQQMGFQDPDLHNPKHDEMIIWLVENIEWLSLDRALSIIKPPTEQTWEDLRYKNYELEKPLIKPRDYLVGFCDVVANLEVDIRYPAGEDRYGRYDSRVGPSELSILYEVKTKIYDLGELLRQLQVYRQYFAHDKPLRSIVVVAPPTPYQKLIEGQGFGFVEYKP